MVAAAGKRLDIVDSIRSFAKSGQPLNEEALQKAVDLINSGNHPRFPGAKQRITVEKMREGVEFLSKAIRDPNSKMSQGLDMLQKRSNDMKAKMQEAKQDHDKPGIWSKIKARIKAFFAFLSFSKGVEKDKKELSASLQT